jgi:hypothetical protein
MAGPSTRYSTSNQFFNPKGAFLMAPYFFLAGSIIFFINSFVHIDWVGGAISTCFIAGCIFMIKQPDSDESDKPQRFDFTVDEIITIRNAKTMNSRTDKEMVDLLDRMTHHIYTLEGRL